MAAATGARSSGRWKRATAERSVATSRREITREFERLHLVLDQIKALEAERRETLLDSDSRLPIGRRLRC